MTQEVLHLPQAMHRLSYSSQRAEVNISGGISSTSGTVTFLGFSFTNSGAKEDGVPEAKNCANRGSFTSTSTESSPNRKAAA